MSTVPGADPTAIETGAGHLYLAPLGSTIPTDLATPWDAAWVPVGYTSEGSTFSIEPNFEDIEVAEELEVIATVETRRLYTLSFAMAQVTASNIQAALNGGTITTGTGIVTYTPPTPGDVTRRMLGWENMAGTKRLVLKRVIQTGSIEMAFQKAPNYATVNTQWRVEKPADASEPFVWIFEDAA